MPACHPHALRFSLFFANRMQCPALLGPSLWTPQGRCVTPGVTTGAR